MLLWRQLYAIRAKLFYNNSMCEIQNIGDHCSVPVPAPQIKIPLSDYHHDAIFRDHSSESGKWLLVGTDGLRCLGGKVTVKLKQSFDALMSPITLHLWENKIYKQLLGWKCQNAQS